MPLTEKERKELEVLDNPDVEWLIPPIGGIFLILSRGSYIKNRKKRVVNLRTKIRIEEEELDKNRDSQRYYEIRSEEEKRFDERFQKRTLKK